jgi:hypothetical protein
MKRVGAAHRVRTPARDHGADPVRAVGTDVGDLGAALLAEGVEEPLQGGLLPAGCGPHQPAGVVVDHHGQVPLLAFVAISSSPIRDRFANRSCTASTSAQTRVMIAPTVRQATASVR